MRVNMINDGGHGANSGAEYEQKKKNKKLSECKKDMIARGFLAQDATSKREVVLAR
jgi:hypothetical protein